MAPLPAGTRSVPGAPRPTADPSCRAPPLAPRRALARALGRLALPALVAAGCKAGPMQPFDAGHEVHVILWTEGAPAEGLRIRPVTTLGPAVVRTPVRRLGGDAPDAVEVALLRGSRGTHRLSVWEPRNGVDARTDLDLDGERWVVVEMVPGRREGRLKVYDRPPHDEIGRWSPLVTVPD